MIEICAVGGYNEVGKNMTALKVDDEVIILDMGIHVENYIKYTEDEDEDIKNLTAKELTSAGALPNIKPISQWRHLVKAIIPTHAHLDHIGAIPFLAKKYTDAEILCTPFTAQVLKTITKDEKIKLENKIQVLGLNSVYQISKKIKIEFVNVTHSTPHTVMVAIHTPKGIIIYANDFKFDRSPVIGDKPNFKKLKALGEKGVLALICDSTYAYDERKMPSENVARQMLKDVLLGTNSTGKAVIVTTFSSHIARLKSIVDYAKRMNRKIVFMGRSLSKYIQAAEAVGLVNLSKEGKIVKYGSKIKKELKKIQKQGKEKFLIICTGHQGERQATLYKMALSELDFNFENEDQVIFASSTIPTPTNIENRAQLEKILKKKGVRLFKDIHVSGHAAREDLRDLINLVKPNHLIPAHGEPRMTSALKDLGLEMNYKLGKTVHLLENGQKLALKKAKNI